MLDNLKLKFAKKVSDEYYDKLVFNMAKEMFFNSTNESKINFFQTLDDSFKKDIAKEITNLFKNELENKKYDSLNNSYFLNNINGRNILINSLLSNNTFETLDGLLMDYSFNESIENLNIKDTFINELKSKVYPDINFNNYVKRDLSFIMHYTTQIQENIIKINKIKTNYSDNGSLNETINQQLENNKVIFQASMKNNNLTKDDFINNIDFIFKTLIDNDIKKYSSNNKEARDIFMLSILDSLDLSKQEQYLILKKSDNFKENDNIFQIFSYAINDKTPIIEQKNYLVIDSKPILPLFSYKEEDVKLFNQLITLIQKETNIDIKKNMLIQFNDHFKLENNLVNLDNVDNISIKEIQKIEKEQKEINQNLNEFENLINGI